jgi:hypothetical protein
MINFKSYKKYDGFRLIGSPVNLGSRLFGANPREKNRGYNQNLLPLFGTPCCLIEQAAAAWRICDYYLISESLTQSVRMST